MEAFSLAVRRRIIELFQSGLEGDDVAEIMVCSPAAARRIWQRYRPRGIGWPASACWRTHAQAQRRTEEAGSFGAGEAEARCVLP